MSAMADTRSRRARRRFTDEFKQQAVRLVLDEGKGVTAVARELDLVPSALGQWVKRAQADRSKGRTGLTTAEREELVRLRKALRIAEEDRDILKKATAFFAKQSRDEVWLHRGEEGRAPRHDPLPVYARDAERVLRVDATRAVGARAARPGAANEAPRVPCRQWGSLRTPAPVERLAGGRRSRQRKARASPDARGADPGPRPEAVQTHDQQRSHRSDCRQCARPGLHGGGAESQFPLSKIVT